MHARAWEAAGRARARVWVGGHAAAQPASPASMHARAPSYPTHLPCPAPPIHPPLPPCSTSLVLVSGVYGSFTRRAQRVYQVCVYCHLVRCGWERLARHCCAQKHWVPDTFCMWGVNACMSPTDTHGCARATRTAWPALLGWQRRLSRSPASSARLAPSAPPPSATAPRWSACAASACARRVFFVCLGGGGGAFGAPAPHQRAPGECSGVCVGARALAPPLPAAPMDTRTAPPPSPTHTPPPPPPPPPLPASRTGGCVRQLCGYQSRPLQRHPPGHAGGGGQRGAGGCVCTSARPPPLRAPPRPRTRTPHPTPLPPSTPLHKPSPPGTITAEQLTSFVLYTEFLQHPYSL